MANKKTRVILDTNWYISATINKKSRRILYDLLKNENITIIFSDEILNEYKRVIQRDKFRSVIAIQQVFRFMNLVISKAETVAIKSNITGRDVNDNFLLSLSNDAKADYLITGDVDLLVLRETGKTKILLLRDFLEITPHKTQ